jgi:hypothetical protein
MDAPGLWAAAPPLDNDDAADEDEDDDEDDGDDDDDDDDDDDEGIAPHGIALVRHASTAGARRRRQRAWQRQRQKEAPAPAPQWEQQLDASRSPPLPQGGSRRPGRDGGGDDDDGGGGDDGNDDGGIFSSEGEGGFGVASSDGGGGDGVPWAVHAALLEEAAALRRANERLRGQRDDAWRRLDLLGHRPASGSGSGGGSGGSGGVAPVGSDGGADFQSADGGKKRAGDYSLDPEDGEESEAAVPAAVQVAGKSARSRVAGDRAACERASEARRRLGERLGEAKSLDRDLNGD